MKRINSFRICFGNVIELIFDFYKMRFKIWIIVTMYNYEIKIQLVFSIISLYNLFKDDHSEDIGHFELQDHQTYHISFYQSPFTTNKFRM